MQINRGNIRYKGIYLHNGQICLTDHQGTPCRPPGMDLSKMTLEEVKALLRLLAEFEREELELIMRERQEAERAGRLH
jgi:hypothetical protein